jgi:hypothetical protein
MVTDLHVQRLRRFDHQGWSKGQSAAKAGIDEKTARKYRRLGKLLVILVQSGPTCGPNPRRKRAHPQRPPVNWFTSRLAQRGTRPQEVEDGQGGRVCAHPTGASH